MKQKQALILRSMLVSLRKKADQQGWQSRWSRKNEKSFLD